ncbi:hypothetical protein TCAL_12144 [Tigriopus californicus]|uniref:BAG domain-containing protein n=1 Tax=Tigriopus californicus TaxID=6832 RepID=A0A553PD90_TIGCA|nr:BAG family molecular chaperone regulator 2-like [Tigriopus californicus]XP_059098868.1 BAG family molecular chaperone regulator 2-like [Tigriopus californicus]XP_059098869.1 BAG family molecular chaperone regulator 2-like [Tigriopus californicus]XP_059098870.1 BAG family molecular chaperone regulator 2-like [Tigriopus californicus]XP_059098871.1 BAG family molecular chaperone regulator 2-like [Tigriopus californicus]XP_059098872.1 BAG family molecular chaperone regulator 2-like [Tigriopus c|eukprot:TCALIF_12144-PA protein Name:"Similar to BAG family molecular chaperone regulator 2 (Bos taurus)" AED:0.08 eAED:0.08 QI:0/-1/0/1/-1/1/1/0/186
MASETKELAPKPCQDTPKEIHIPDLDHILEVLDDVEKRIEDYQKQAIALIGERRSLESTLETLHLVPEDATMGEVDQQDVNSHVERLRTRLATVTVQVETARDDVQAQAWAEVNTRLEALISSIENGELESKAVLEKYLNSCSFETATEDPNFEKLVLSCCLDDQKKVRQRLKTMAEQIEGIDFSD